MKLTIGRSADCDIRIADPFVSLRHASVTRDSDGVWWLADEGSMNGTRVNGARVFSRTRVLPGDVVMFSSASICRGAELIDVAHRTAEAKLARRIDV